MLTIGNLCTVLVTYPHLSSILLSGIFFINPLLSNPSHINYYLSKVESTIHEDAYKHVSAFLVRRLKRCLHVRIQYVKITAFCVTWIELRNDIPINI